MSAHRRARLGEQLRRELTAKLRYLVRDPGLGPVTVTGVDVTADLWLARVHVEPQGSEREKRETMEALRRAGPFLRSVLGRELHIRRMPELRFQRDRSVEAGRRIEEILKQVLPPDDSGPGVRSTDRLAGGAGPTASSPDSPAAGREDRQD